MSVLGGVGLGRVGMVVPLLLLTPAAVAADRSAHRVQMVAALNGASAITVAAVPVLYAIGGLGVAGLVTVVLIEDGGYRTWVGHPGRVVASRTVGEHA
jgi:hypothetical protein